MSVIDHSPVFAPFFNSQKYVHVKDSAVTKNFYVATTGSDANNGEAIGTPFLTIQKALNVAGSSIWGGQVTINIADGTYVENLIGRDLIGSANDQSRGNSLVRLLGNTAVPGNVIVQGSAVSRGTFLLVNCSTTYWLDGMTLKSDGSLQSAAIKVDQARISISNLDIANAGFGIFALNNAYVQIDDSAAGGTYAVTNVGLEAVNSCIIRVLKALTITGFTNRGLFSSESSIIDYEPPAGSTITFTADPATKAFVCFLATFGGSIALVLTGAGTMNITDITRAGLTHVIQVLNGGFMVFSGSGTSTVNVTNASRIALISQNSFYFEIATFTWVYVGVTQEVEIEPGSADLGLNNFSSATYALKEISTNQKYGSDFRYLDPVRGTHTGSLPLGTTAYFTNDQLQSVYSLLYTALQDERIDKLQIDMGTGNGAAHTDTFTVVKNGVDTTMTLSITNAATGSTTTNPVTLAAGDTVGIKAVTDAATAGANVLSTLSIRKT